MTFAQTIVELPKYGASDLEAAISVASDPAPAAKTTPVSVAWKRFSVFTCSRGQIHPVPVNWMAA